MSQIPAGFQTTNQLAISHGVKCLTYGLAGVGKTFLISTAPSPLILSAESGLLTLKNFEIPVWPIGTIQDLDNAYRWIIGSAEARNFSTICLDSLSEIAEQVLANEMPKSKDPRKAYGELLIKMRDYVIKFRDLSGFHVYMTAKEGWEKDDATGVLMRMPSAPGRKLGPMLPYFFDLVFHLDMGQTPEGVSYRFLRTQPEFNIMAKSRGGMLEQYEYPDLNAIFNKLLS
ncbi:MAG: ATP-binding protein [Synergistaceae bacterium]